MCHLTVTNNERGPSKKSDLSMTALKTTAPAIAPYAQPDRLDTPNIPSPKSRQAHITNEAVKLMTYLATWYDRLLNPRADM
jgi:hypothetical protein